MRVPKAGFFCALSPAAELRDFDSIKIVSAYPAGAVLFSEGQIARGIYLLCEGEVKVCFTSRDGKTLILRTAEPGDVLGNEAALSRLPYEATAESLRPSQIAFAPLCDFRQFVVVHPHIFARIALQLGSHYKAACEQLRTLGFGDSVKNRIARFLLDRCKEGEGPQNEGVFVLTMSHQQIAEYLGTTRESVTRSMADLKNKGIAEKDGAKVIIHDRSALRALSP